MQCNGNASGREKCREGKVNAFYRSLVTMLVSLNRRSDLGMGNVDVLYRPPLLCYFVCIGNQSSASPETPRPADANIWVCHNSRRGEDVGMTTSTSGCGAVAQRP